MRENEGQGTDRTDALRRAMLSLEGLSCGDAFGECFFLQPKAPRWVAERTLPPATWHFTDDTMMAVSVLEVLRMHGEIAEERLADHFARMYDPWRGYGPAMNDLLLRVLERGGAAWKEEAGALFEGRGSFGNGSAMRVAPLGAYFADDFGRLALEAERAAVTTHAHAEGASGAIAVALGAALAWKAREEAADAGEGVGEAEMDPERGRRFLEEIRSLMPASEVRNGIEKALRLRETASAREAAAMLGNGSRVTTMDTVPFALWVAGRWMGSFEEAMWQTVSGGGDMDTTCAIVGGMVAMRTGLGGIPEEWRRRRESLATVVAKAAAM